MASVHITFNTKTSIQWYEENKKKAWYVTDVMPNETVMVFKDILKSSETTLFLKSYDDLMASVKIDTIKNIQNIP